MEAVILRKRLTTGDSAGWQDPREGQGQPSTEQPEWAFWVEVTVLCLSLLLLTDGYRLRLFPGEQMTLSFTFQCAPAGLFKKAYFLLPVTLAGSRKFNFFEVCVSVCLSLLRPLHCNNGGEQNWLISCPLLSLPFDIFF